MNNNGKVINISKKTFISVVIMLLVVIVAAIALTYIIPKGQFKTNADGTIDYSVYELLPNKGGINILKGIASPILVMFADGGISIIMLCIFILVISGCFQVMSDTNGIKAIVSKLISKFKDKKRLLLAIVSFIFMCFGAFFGLFEEVLTLLPIIIMLTISLGYDSFTAFLVCIVSTGFGFASAITNPFTVLIVADSLGISPMAGLWLRIIMFISMYALIILYTFNHIRRIKKDPEKSPTFESDETKRADLLNVEKEETSKKTFVTYVIFLLTVLVSIFTFTSIPALRDYTVVGLIVVFLFGGLICGFIVEPSKKKTLKSFLSGILSALPTLLLILMASSIRYILEEGKILATVANSISTAVNGKSPIVVILMIYFIILALEFFISSSTAKALFVMGILSCVKLNVTNNTLVLAYLFADGYSNVLFPTSPVLLIGLSMIGINYLSWIKKSKFLFIINIAIVILFLIFATLIKY